MDQHPFSPDEHMAASAVVSLAGGPKKRDHDDGSDVDMPDCKKARMVEQPKPHAPQKSAPVPRILRAAPFFFYKDWSTHPDVDALSPLTAPGRVPNFPAKMHAILQRADLRGIVAWLPHGRSWRVIKPREFEIKVLPKVS